MKKGWIIFLSVIGFFAILNLGILDWVVLRGRGELWSSFVPPTGGASAGKDVGQEEVEESKEKIATGSCELSCQEIIEEKIKEGLAKLPFLAGESSVSTIAPRKISPTTVPNDKLKVVYVSLVTEGTVSSADWTDVVPSEFYFNINDYPGAREVRFEAYLASANNDQGYARLYDATNKRGVDFSDLLFNQSAFTRVESSGIKIWKGNNKYTIQLRSVNATQVQIKEAKLKVLY